MTDLSLIETLCITSLIVYPPSQLSATSPTTWLYNLRKYRLHHKITTDTNNQDNRTVADSSTIE